MANDKLMNHTQGEDIIANLETIAQSLENLSAVSPAKFGMGYAVTNTAADTAAKTANIANFTLTEGAPVNVKFTYANTATNATLNLNNTGAKPILYKGSPITTDIISAGDICTFIYSSANGGSYNIINIDALSGAGAGTVKSVGASTGIKTDQTGGAVIITTGSVKLDLKSETPFEGSASTPVEIEDKIYPVVLDADGHPAVSVPGTEYTSGAGINISEDNEITNTGVFDITTPTSSDTTATDGDIKVTKKVVNSGVTSDSVTFVKPKGINDPAFKALDSSTSGLTADDDHVPTSKTVQDAIDTALASASIYKGTIAAFNDLPTSTATVIVRKGWYYRVSTAWSAATGTPATDVGDIIIAEIDSPSKSIDGTNWSLLHNEANTDANVAQSPVSTNAEYEVLFSGSADNTAHTEGTGKDSGLTYNPSTNKLTVSGEVSGTGFTGDGVKTSFASQTSDLSDKKVPSEKLVKDSLDTKVTSIKAPVSGTSTKVDKNNEVSFQQASGQNPAVTVTGNATNGTVTIEHQTGAGYNHIPSSGSTGQYLRNIGTAGSASWTSPLTSWPTTPEHTDVLPSTKLLDDRFDANEANISSVEDMVCDDEFNTTTDYNIGDIVTHDHGLYQFKSAHTKGTWNSSHVNQITITDQILDLNRLVRNTQPIYGYRIDKNNLDPDTRVEYLFDAVGMTPAYMNFSTGQFNYGSWGDIWFIKNNKPVALNFDGTEAFELNPTNYWQKSDGTTAINIEDDTLNYNYMSRIPTVYVKRWEDSQYNYVAFTQYPQGGFTAYAHQAASGRINENMYLPMFKGFKDSNGKLRSLAGKTPWNTTGGIGYELDAAKAIATTNNGWQIWDFAKHELISDLLTLISKHTSSRWKFGKGVIKTDSSTAGFCKGGYEYDGTTKATCAQFWGTDEGTGNTPSTEDGSHHVRVFHIEDLWGNRWDRCLGLHLINGIYKVKMFAPYYATAPTGSGALLPDETYETLSLTPPSGNYLQNQSTGFYGNIPISTSGDKNKGYCSYFWQSSGADRLLVFGGRCDYGFSCSARYLYLSRASVFSNWYIGASPCFNHL